MDKSTGRWGTDHLKKLEHVQLFLTMSTPTRGDIVLKLTSPSKTTSKLLSMRPEDNADSSPRYVLQTDNSGLRLLVRFWLVL